MSISIIVPMHNSENTVHLTIESIQNQTYTNYKVLLIDDGSTDKTAEVCRELVGDDARFHYFYKPNGGVSSARNYGIEKVDTPYIAFLDSDDVFDPRYLEAMFQRYEEDPSIDLVACSYTRNNKYIYLGDRNITNYDMVTTILDEDGPMGYVCNKLYRSDVLREHHVHFDETLHYGEDLLYNVTYLSHIKKVGYVNEVLYFYVVGETSISSRLNHPKTLTHINALQKVIERVESMELDEKTRLRFRNTFFRISLGYLFRHSIANDKDKIQKFDALLKTMNPLTTRNLFLSSKMVAGKAYLAFRKMQVR
ncbi:glycosyltransferase family 2 protein [Ruoffia sp. FAM 24228]|uniref:glycosyltransferase family 2 protein n=1 Tax=Ruoffia sp. FAM 24228 TaxID=3259517 RepID=UPI00388461B7